MLGPSGSSSSRSAASSAMSPPPSSDSVDGEPNLSFTGGPIGAPIARIKSAIFHQKITSSKNFTQTCLSEDSDHTLFTTSPLLKFQENVPNVFTTETKSPLSTMTAKISKLQRETRFTSVQCQQKRKNELKYSLLQTKYEIF
uniref:Uncharacterized protein n=1 Tax=Pectinophora gossypiella TaxID=13191 RepID=A0A1E1WFV9_PECGO